MFPKILRREIVALLILKAILLTALYYTFFGSGHEMRPTPADLQSHMLDNGKP